MRSWKTGYSSTLDFWQCSVYFTYTLGNQSGGRVFLFLHTDEVLVNNFFEELKRMVPN